MHHEMRSPQRQRPITLLRGAAAGQDIVALVTRLAGMPYQSPLHATCTRTSSGPQETEVRRRAGIERCVGCLGRRLRGAATATMEILPSPIEEKPG